MSLEHYIGFLAVVLIVLVKDRLASRRQDGIDTNIYERLASLEARIKIQEERRIPPEWFQEQVADIKHAVDALRATCPASRDAS